MLGTAVASRLDGMAGVAVIAPEGAEAVAVDADDTALARAGFATAEQCAWLHAAGAGLMTRAAAAVRLGGRAVLVFDGA